MQNFVTPNQSVQNSFQTLNSARGDLSPMNSKRSFKFQESLLDQNNQKNIKPQTAHNLLNEEQHNYNNSEKMHRTSLQTKQLQNNSQQDLNNVNQRHNIQVKINGQDSNIALAELQKIHSSQNIQSRNKIHHHSNISFNRNRVRSQQQLRSGRIRQGTNLSQRSSLSNRTIIFGLNEGDAGENSLQKFLNEKIENAIALGKKHRLKQGVLKWLYQTESRRKKLIKNEHLQLLNDQSIFLEEEKLQNPEENKEDNFIIQKGFENLYTNVLNIFDTLIANIFVCIEPFHPFNKTVFYAYIIENTTIIFFIWFYSMYSFFEVEWKDFFFYFNIFGLIIFTFSSFMKLNTGYFEQGKVVIERNKIVAQYRVNQLLYDFIGFFCILYMVIVDNHNEYTRQNEFERQLSIYVWTLLKLLGSSLALGHIVATLYFFLAVIEEKYLDISDSWVRVNGLADSEPLIQYLESYYWASATITLIGFKGDTNLETLYCIVTLIWTVGVFATILSTVTMVWEAKEAKQKEYKKAKDTLNQFFSMHQLSQDLYGQMHNYLQYSFQGHKEKTVNKEFEDMVIHFPKNLQELVQMERYSKVVEDFTILKNNFSQFTVKSVIQNLEEDYFMPNQVIYDQDEQEERYLYLIIAGEVEIYQDTQQQRFNKVQHLKEGQFFGFQTFFTNQNPKYSAKSSNDSYTSVIKISRSNFIDIVDQRDEDHETFQMIKQQLIHNKNSNILKQQCQICGQNYHYEDNCNLLNYRPNTFNLLRRLNYYQETLERDKTFKRKQYRQVQTLQALMDLADCKYELLAYGGPEIREKIETLQVLFKSGVQNEDAIDENKNDNQINKNSSSSTLSSSSESSSSTESDSQQSSSQESQSTLKQSIQKKNNFDSLKQKKMSVNMQRSIQNNFMTKSIKQNSSIQNKIQDKTVNLNRRASRSLNKGSFNFQRKSIDLSNGVYYNGEQKKSIFQFQNKAQNQNLNNITGSEVSNKIVSLTGSQLNNSKNSSLKQTVSIPIFENIDFSSDEEKQQQKKGSFSQLKSSKIAKSPRNEQKSKFNLEQNERRTTQQLNQQHGQVNFQIFQNNLEQSEKFKGSLQNLDQNEKYDMEHITEESPLEEKSLFNSKRQIQNDSMNQDKDTSIVQNKAMLNISKQNMKLLSKEERKYINQINKQNYALQKGKKQSKDKKNNETNNSNSNDVSSILNTSLKKSQPKKSKMVKQGSVKNAQVRFSIKGSQDSNLKQIKQVIINSTNKEIQNESKSQVKDYSPQSNRQTQQSYAELEPQFNIDQEDNQYNNYNNQDKVITFQSQQSLENEEINVSQDSIKIKKQKIQKVDSNPKSKTLKKILFAKNSKNKNNEFPDINEESWNSQLNSSREKKEKKNFLKDGLISDLGDKNPDLLVQLLVNLISQNNQKQQINNNINQQLLGSQKINNSDQKRQSLTNRKSQQIMEGLLALQQPIGRPSNYVLQQALQKLDEDEQVLQNQMQQKQAGQTQLPLDQIFYSDMDKLWNYRFFFIYNNFEFTIPSYNKVQKQNILKALKQKKNIQPLQLKSPHHKKQKQQFFEKSSSSKNNYLDPNSAGMNDQNPLFFHNSSMIVNKNSKI